MSFSVLLSVYLGENPRYLDQSLNSIWCQQTLKPSQIVLVKDGPLTSELEASIGEWGKSLGKKLTLVPLSKNVGLGAALNAGLSACKFELVARMDTDDISFPERFEKQVAFMKRNPHVVAASAQLEEWDESMKRLMGKRTLPLEAKDVLRFAKKRSPLNHPLAIYRKSVVQSVGGYPPLRKAQDYALWSLLLSKGYCLENMPDILLKMRSGDEMLSRRGWEFYRHELELLRYQRKIGFLGFYDFCFNSIGRASLRLSPSLLKRIFYRFAR